MSAKDRLKKFREDQGLTRREMADFLGVKPSKVQDIETGKQRINEDFLILVSEKCNIDVGYLITGQHNNAPSLPDSSSLYAPSKNHEDLVYIPQFDIELSAGTGAYPADHPLAIASLPFSSNWLIKKGLQAHNLKLLRVMGDSMEPLLKDKDMVMIDTSRIKPTEAMPFAIRLDGDLFVKGIQRQGDGSLVLVSRNKAYNDLIINSKQPPEDFVIIGAVVWHAHSWI
ncbi:phage repressor protein C with HTH and peptisase S24 domain [Marinomonas balearica]|uniref:Phage repressor protein C with HTH and peptisase S24 domain n=2 Tax=Marinomonas balearica TaxID=491947 RepID=A0A4R6M9X2_9GAMM|nr:XRE family transcriptional regulator [Marinomonas balearica]TDO97440.1 phage repressor protein C with HTH and peptisase S24 domain [Marinomonas balearica]